MTEQTLPDLDFLRQCFRLDPETGKVFWRHRPTSHFPDERTARLQNARLAGQEAFKTHDSGYRRGQVTADGKIWRLAEHRVGFALRHGREPNGHLDHINGDTADNRPENLREATRSQNMANRKRTTGKKMPKGVYHYPKWGPKYSAIIRRNNRNIYLGRFDTAEQALRAYNSVALLVNGEFSRPDSICQPCQD